MNDRRARDGEARSAAAPSGAPSPPAAAGASLSRRLYCLRWWECHGRHTPATCRRFGIDAATFRAWSRRYGGAIRWAPGATDELSPAEAVAIAEAILRLARNSSPGDPG